jgi:voltage-gated potassium channel
VALQLLIAVSMVIFTMMVHVAGLAGLLLLTPQRSGSLGVRRAIAADVAVLLLVMNGLFFLHLFEVLAYALLYVAGGAIRTFSDAVLFSSGDYATLSTDVSVRPGWRLVAAMEGANGVILLGFSTAFLVSVVARLRELLDAWMRRKEKSQPCEPQCDRDRPRALKERRLAQARRRR